MENEQSTIVEQEVPVCEAQPCENQSCEVKPAQEKTPEAPAKKEDDSADVSRMVSEIAELKAQLRESNIKSAIAERRLVPLDQSLVTSMISERMKNGMNPSDAVSDLYNTHPYLFKGVVSQIAEQNETAEKAKQSKELNDRFVSSVIERLKRTNINPIGGNQ